MPEPDPKALPESEPHAPAAVPPPAPRGRMGFPAAFLGSIIVMGLFFGFALWRCERVAATAASQPSAMVTAAARAFKEVLQLQPQVTINERVILQQSSPILELSVQQREVEVERELEHAWMGSTKRVRVRGTFRVKAGFDLTQPFSVAFSDAPGAPVRIELPAPRILSVETLQTEILAYENGLWNKISTKILEGEINALPNAARAKALRGGLTREVEKSVLEQLSERFPKPPGIEVKVVPPAPRDAPPSVSP